MHKRKRLIPLSGGCLAALLLLLLLFDQFRPINATPSPTAVHPKWDDALTATVNKPAQLGPQKMPGPHDRTAAANEGYSYILHLNEQADLTALPPGQTGQSAPIVDHLQALAAATQPPLIRSLERSRGVDQYQPLWIINAIVVKSDLAALLQLSDHEAVAQVTLDAPRELIPQLEITTSPPPTSVTWGLQRIGADRVWHGLGIDGDGVTVATLDSGVDWTHSALSVSYRGGPGEHAGHWFDASADAFTTPVDLLGHGTHVMGTIAGQGGLGVAPGADWITVKIVDEFGLIRDSYVHLAFQWILAPNGDPDLAPDIINNSWGNSAPAFSGFWPDVAAVQAAGILNIFAVGNTGPGFGTVAAPASYTGTIAIGAADPFDGLTYFSSQGPSPFTTAYKPAVVAPGARVLSTLPDGEYGFQNGTSMAAPHAAGALALLLSANPGHTAASAGQLLTTTAGLIGPYDLPNHSFGYGMVDAVALVAADVAHGTLTGQVRGEGQALPGAVFTVTTPAGAQLRYDVDTEGRYTALLRPGTYQGVTSAFGYSPADAPDIIIGAGETIVHDFDLNRLPAGTISGQVLGDEVLDRSGIELRVLGTGQIAVTDITGHFSLTLPAGQFQLQLFHLGYEIQTQTIDVVAAGSARADFTLVKRPTVLLINGNQWLYDPHIKPYRQSLLDNKLAYYEWTVLNPYIDTPPLALLRQYDVVVWASPRFAPAYIDFTAQIVISDYLGLGGNLLVAGQDIANIEGQGIFGSYWFQQIMGADYQDEAQAPYTLTGGLETDFSELDFTLNGADSDQNQLYPDELRLRRGYLARPLLHYADGTIGAVGSGECQPHSLVFLGFGLEGVTGRAQRAALIASALDQFGRPAPQAGVEFAVSPIDDFVVAGESRRYELPFYNLGEFITDTFHISAAGVIWPTTIVSETVTVGPCQASKTAVEMVVPRNLPLGVTQTVTLRIQSDQNPLISDTLTIHHATPTGEVLLVDDDRWYDFEWRFEDGLAANDIPYDVWEIGWDNDVRGSPSQALLGAYPFVIWYTGYDWFQPVTPAELQTIQGYLNGGGRLFLNSQDFLYHHHDESFSHVYLGILDYQESVTPTSAFAGRANPSYAQLLDVYPLKYGPYQNFSDALVPVPGARTMLWHNRSGPAGIAYSQAPWRTVFWGVPLETLPAAAHAAAVQDSLSWLSDLGDSTFVVSEPAGPWSIGERRGYTLTIANNALVANVVTVTNPLPAEVAPLPATLSGGATYDGATHTIRWQGVIPAGGVSVVAYTVELATALPPKEPILNGAELRYSRHQIPVRRVAIAWPDTTAVAGTFAISGAVPGAPFSSSLELWLTEPFGTMSGTLLLPAEVRLLDGSLTATAGTVQRRGRLINWQLSQPDVNPVTVGMVYTASPDLEERWLPFGWQIQLDEGYPHIWHTIRELQPWRQLLPIFAYR